jgi:hypothetical protein
MVLPQRHSNARSVMNMASKTYTIVVEDLAEQKLIDKAIAIRKGNAAKVLYRGAYDVTHRQEYNRKQQALLKAYTAAKTAAAV